MDTRTTQRPAQEQSADQSQLPRNRPVVRMTACGVEPEQLLYSIRDGRRILGGIGRTTVWRMINAGQLETVKIGGRTFLKAESVRRAAADGAATAAE